VVISEAMQAKVVDGLEPVKPFTKVLEQPVLDSISNALFHTQ